MTQEKDPYLEDKQAIRETLLKIQDSFANITNEDFRKGVGALTINVEMLIKTHPIIVRMSKMEPKEKQIGVDDQDLKNLCNQIYEGARGDFVRDMQKMAKFTVAKGDNPVPPDRRSELAGLLLELADGLSNLGTVTKPVVYTGLKRCVKNNDRAR